MRFDQADIARRIHAQMFQIARGEHFPHPTQQRQTPITTARKRRLPGSFCPEVQQPSVRIPALCIEKTAAITDIGIIVPKLVTVIAQREWLGQRAFKRLEPPKATQPVWIIETQRRRTMRVGIAQGQFRKVGRLDRIEKIFAQRMNGGFGLKRYSPSSAPKWVCTD